MRVAALLLALCGVIERPQQAPLELFTPGRFATNEGTALPYRLLKPATIEPGRTYPLVLQLHASGAIGTDNASQIGAFSNGWLLPAMRDKYAAFVLIPQFPGRTVEYADVAEPSLLRSKPTALLAPIYQLVDTVIKDFPIDRSRIYVVGFSMGASSALQALMARPDLFAAAMAIAAVPPDSSWVPAAPILMLHGDADTENPFIAARAWAQAMQAKGAREIEFRAYPGLQHELPPDLPAAMWWRDWLFSKRRR
jgi:predicted peptidase